MSWRMPLGWLPRVRPCGGNASTAPRWGGGTSSRAKKCEHTSFENVKNYYEVGRLGVWGITHPCVFAMLQYCTQSDMHLDSLYRNACMKSRTIAQTHPPDPATGNAAPRQINVRKKKYSQPRAWPHLRRSAPPWSAAPGQAANPLTTEHLRPFSSVRCCRR